MAEENTLEDLAERVASMEQVLISLGRYAEASHARTQLHEFLMQINRDLTAGIFNRAGITEISGTPINEWWAQRTVERLRERLFELEDENPALASQIQALVIELNQGTEGL